MALQFIVLMLLVRLTSEQMITPGLVLAELRAASENSTTSQVAVSSWYPDVTIGPSSWEYFRVEIPVSFSILSIAFTKKKWTAEGKGPLLCFRFGGLPLPSPPLESLQLAVINAGSVKNASSTGKCAYLTDTVSIDVTNAQVVSGLLYIGAFSDPSSSRSQSKMISRGAKYHFETEVLATACMDNLVGENCTETISFAPYDVFHSAPPTGNGTTSPLAGANMSDNSSWSSSVPGCVVNGGLTYFILQVPDLASTLDILIKGEASLSNVRLFARHSAFPQSTDEISIKENRSTIEAPQRGPWYLGITAENTTGSGACFSLTWRVQTCLAGYAGVGCSWPSIVLERVLTKPGESPYDSKYVPLQKPVHTSGFTRKLVNNSTSGNWLYFLLEVPKGAAGSVLSSDLRFSKGSVVNVYGRLEGYPSNSSWDFHHTSENNRSLSFDMIYPAEGVWSIGVLYSLQEDSSEVDMNARITLHGCNKSCSHSGTCTTNYDASRLTFFSYCSCDRTHGGIDCSEKLLSLSEKSVQIFALVGSNVAAILPSLWSLRQRAFSEWLVYTTSGISSAIYHSCDAGGWCAMSFDTLQFLDFWLSFLAVIFTFLYLAEVLGLNKTSFHMAAAIVTAIIAKRDRTSAKSAFAVIAIGALGLLLGVALELWRQNPIQRWRSFSGLRRCSAWYSLEHRGREFFKKLKGKFIWAYVATGVMIVGFAGLCWKFEKANTYWIWHSLWHVSIFTGAFFLLFSVAGKTVAENNNNNEDIGRNSSGEIPAETDTFMRQ